MTKKAAARPENNKTPQLEEEDRALEITPKPRTTPLNLTAEEAAIFQRVQAESNDWQTITEADMEDFSLMADPFELPIEAKRRAENKVLAFRWAENKPARIDQLRNAEVPLRWWIANATTTPFLSKYCDPILGAIQKLDQILMFKPRWMQEKVLEAKRDLAVAVDRGGELKSKELSSNDSAKWSSGDKARIADDGDVIMDPGQSLEGAYAQDEIDTSGLDELIVE